MNDIKISYCIGTHNEGPTYLIPLFDTILKHMDPVDELVVIDDYSDDQATIKVLDTYSDRINLFQHKLDSDFASHKNFMIEHCKGDYIFNCDADEMPAPTLLQTIKEIILNNPDIDLFHIPRINIVQGITPEDITRYGWIVNEKQFINFPDLQARVFKNNPQIRWVGKVHETITGTQTHTPLPFVDSEGKIVTDYALLHVKSIDRQRKQNEFYNQIQ